MRYPKKEIDSNLIQMSVGYNLSEFTLLVPICEAAFEVARYLQWLYGERQ
jgi:hypothetical protein